jgi:outer membrane protein assembly factor BamB
MKMRMRTAQVLTGVLIAAGLAWPSAQPAEWHQWRGPHRDGISAETGLLQRWPSHGPPQVWRAAGAGEGYSSFSASAGRLYTLGARGGTEYLSAFDLETGRKLWEQPNGQRFRNDRGDGPRSTPTVDGNRLFVFGGSGDLTSFDAATGDRIWHVNVVRDHGGVVPYWGYSESPLIVSDRVLVNVGGRGASIVAFDKTNGTVLWRSESDEAGYSSPMLLRTGSLSQVVYFTGRRALAVDARDGRLLWSYPRVSNRTANIATPIVRGTQVFLSSDYGTGGALLQVKAAGNLANADEVYFTRDMRNHHASSVLVDEHLYGFSGSILTAMRFASGEVAWRDRSVGKGSVIVADGRLYLYSENGVVGLAEATPDGYREHGRFRIQQGNLPTWSHPIITGGRLILRDQDTVYAFDVRRQGGLR